MQCKEECPRMIILGFFIAAQNWIAINSGVAKLKMINLFQVI